ncbi:alpha/beta hydrolase [Colwelliaceae bacterium BS250]
MNINKSFTLVLLLLLPFLTVQAIEMNETSDFTLSKIQVVPIKDTQADKQYELYIKLPEEYAKNKDKTYPVIYFTDAMWHIELLSSSTEYLMEEAILVGISWQQDINEDLKKEYGAHYSRNRDYSMRKSSKPEIQAKHHLGQASNHLDFIRNDVIKTVENNYRTDPDRRTYFGYSAGGEFGAYILLTQPDTFKNYILGSPAIKGDIPFLAKLGSNAALKGKGLNANVFISYGSLEKEAGKHIEEFITLLKNKNDKSLSLKHAVIEGSHQSAFPLTGVRSVTWLSNITNITTEEE